MTENSENNKRIAKNTMFLYFVGLSKHEKTFILQFIRKNGEKQETHQETHQEITDTMRELIGVMNTKQMYSARELMELLQLKDMGNFRKLYLTPSVKASVIHLKYPDNLKHRAQRYYIV